MKPDNSSEYVLLTIAVFVLIAAGVYQFFIHKPDAISELPTALIATPSPAPIVSPSPSPSPSPFVMPSEKTKKWLLAAGGILSTNNQEGYDELYPKNLNEEFRKSLIESWGMSDHDSTIATINWLKFHGHREEFEKKRRSLVEQTHDDEKEYQRLKPQLMRTLPHVEPESQEFVLDLIWKHRHETEVKSLVGWDYARMINICRWGYGYGFISEEEAWSNMLYAGKELQNTFSSWDDLSKNYVIGRTYWQGSGDNAYTVAAINWLKTDPKSPWKKNDWETELK
jgi:hypothetical protein